MSETPRTDYGPLDWLDENQECSREFATYKGFFAKHALGPKAPPSCFVCGREVRGTPAIQHMELPGVVACHSCRDAPRDLREAVELQQKVYAWLGYWRDNLPPEAVTNLQDILGPLAAAPTPKDAT